jgi:hypothetical protein
MWEDEANGGPVGHVGDFRHADRSQQWVGWHRGARAQERTKKGGSSEERAPGEGNEDHDGS